MRARRLALLVLPLLLLLMAPGTAGAAAEITEKLQIDTVDGAKVSVEVRRPAEGRVPIVLTYSPYNVLNFPGETSDAYGDRYVPRGYARAVADVIGTRNSSGCWDYGGRKEQQSGVDLVNALARQPWSNGKVAMIGGSYDGTTATMVAARGADAPGLAAIVPIAAISRWYGYAYSHGVRYAGNSQKPTDEGADTPLGFDFGFGRTPPTDPGSIGAAADRIRPCDADEHTARGYDTTPDYDAFWLERDYRKDAAKVRVPALVVHGWQDYNVKQEEGVDLFAALPGRGEAFKRLYLFQGAHGLPKDPGFATLLDAFFERTLKGADTGVEREAPVITQGRDHDGPDASLRSEAAWPPPTTGEIGLALGRAGTAGTLGGPGRGSAAYTDAGGTEETAAKHLDAEAQWLAYRSEPLTADARIAGAPVLDLTVRVDRDHGQLVPTLYDLAPDGAAVPITRGFLNLAYRDGLGSGKPAPVGQALSAQVTFKPQDWTVRRGHRIALLLESSNTAWAVPDDPGLHVDVLGDGASGLRLPLVGAGRPAGAKGGAGSPLFGSPVPGASAPVFGSARSRLTATLRRSGRRRGRVVRLRVTGRSGGAARVLVRLQRRGRTVLTRRVRARHGAYAVTFRVRRGGGYRAIASRDGVRARTKLVKLR
jgi:X-Pro dipeptidyl-peptidase